MINLKDILKSSSLAGIFISIAGLVFLTVGGIIGSMLFAFGLFGVIITSSHLYTGKAGFEQNLVLLTVILVGNVMGCAMAGLATQLMSPGVIETATQLIEARINAGWYICILKGIGCGIIMSTIILASKKDVWYPLMFGIPVFILSGFYHSVADAYYFFVSPKLSYIPYWLCVVLGNYFGCKLLFLKKLIHD